MRGRRHLKIKVGLDDECDLERLKIASKSLGPDAQLRVDANGVWAAERAIRVLRRMAKFNVRSVEQPVNARDLDGMRRVREECGVPVVADESLCSFEDGMRLIQHRAADIFNIRVGKCGGLLPSLQLVRLAYDNGLKCQLGTLVGETGILMRAAEIFGQRAAEFEFLEGKSQNRELLVDDLILSQQEGETYALGLSIKLSQENLKRFSTSPPIVIEASRRTTWTLPARS
jgi:L-alanine-DL-glutamate epimerase-like enolase superfamily enzyme